MTEKLNDTHIRVVVAYAAAGMQLAGAGRRVCMHPQSVRYNLNKVKELTGKDPRIFCQLNELLRELRKEGRIQ